MYKPIHDLQLSPQSLQYLADLQRDLANAQIGLYLISVGHVYSLILGYSSHSSRVISISTSDWDAYQQSSNHAGVLKGYINAVNAIIRNKACLVAIEFSGDEQEFWSSLGGERCPF